MDKTVEDQKDALVKEILSAFEEPSNWPLTDSQRVELIRRWYLLAKQIHKATPPSPPPNIDV